MGLQNPRTECAAGPGIYAFSSIALLKHLERATGARRRDFICRTGRHRALGCVMGDSMQIGDERTSMPAVLSASAAGTDLSSVFSEGAGGVHPDAALNASAPPAPSEAISPASPARASRTPPFRWTQQQVPSLRYRPQNDPRGRGNHYLWEGRTGLGMRCYQSGHRTWVCATTVKDPVTNRPRARFFCLGEVRGMSLRAARLAATARLSALHNGVDPRPLSVARDAGNPTEALGQRVPKRPIRFAPESPVSQRTDASPTRARSTPVRAARPRSAGVAAPAQTQAERRRPRPIGETSLKDAIAFYVANRNCAPRSKRSLVSALQNLHDWRHRPLLRIDAVMLKRRYHEVMARVQTKGAAFDARWAQLPPREQLQRARPGYRTGIKAALDTVMSFGRVFKYWVKMHQAPLLRAGVAVPDCPAQALADDLIAEPQRVKSLPVADLRTLVRSFETYPGNPLHTLLARFLLASGLRVGITLCCKPEHIKADRIEIPAHTENSKVRWNRRHLAHLAKIVPLTPEIEQILTEIRAAAPNHGDASAWLFPSRTSRSGHMEEVKAAVLPLRQHSGVRFTMHQFRHNFATAAEELGYSRLEITELLGQATGYGPDRYIDQRVKRQRAQLLAIGARLKAVVEAPEAAPASCDSPAHLVQPGAEVQCAAPHARIATVCAAAIDEAWYAIGSQTSNTLLQLARQGSLGTAESNGVRLEGPMFASTKIHAAFTCLLCSLLEPILRSRPNGSRAF